VQELLDVCLPPMRAFHHVTSRKTRCPLCVTSCDGQGYRKMEDIPQQQGQKGLHKKMDVCLEPAFRHIQEVYVSKTNEGGVKNVKIF